MSADRRRMHEAGAAEQEQMTSLLGMQRWKKQSAHMSQARHYMSLELSLKREY